MANQVLPRVSIVTPSYNQAPFLEQTIRSVLAQDHADIEYLVMDGGSTDGSVEIIQRFAGRLAHWVSERDRGQVDALNKGFARSTGDILAWINSDDLYREGAVARVAQFMQRHPEIDIVYGVCDLIDEAGRFVGRLGAPPFDLAHELTGNLIAQPATFFRRAVYESLGGLDPRYHYAFDYAFWLQAGMQGYHFASLPAPALAAFRMWQESKSEGSSSRFVPEMLAIYEGVFADPRLPKACRRLKGRAIASAWRFAAFGSYRSGHMGDAWHCLRQMGRADPRSLLSAKVVALGGKMLLGATLSDRMRRWRRAARWRTGG